MNFATGLRILAQTLTGWQKEKALGRSIGEIFVIINEKTRAAAENPVDNVLKTGRILALANHNALLNVDGKEIPIEDSAAPVRDLDGNVFGVVLVFHDVTEKRRAHHALEANEEKYRTLFENMTEEVHYWEIVRDEEGQIKTWRLVDANPPTIRTWGKKLDEIRGKTTDEIFGPGASQHYMPIVKKIMTDRVPHAYEDFFPNLNKHFLFTSVPLKNPFITTGSDITAVKSAQEALQKSEQRLRLAQQVARIGSFEWDLQTQVSIGIGIAKDQWEKIFDPFHQVDMTTTREFGGAGIGLALSRRIASLLGGQLLLAERDVGQGSTFVLAIPVGNGRSKEKISEEKNISPSALSGMKILLAEDMPDAQVLMKQILQKNGVVVTIAGNGEDAVNKALSQEFDVIVMDIRMPKKDGLAATRELRARGYTKPIVALSAHALRAEQHATKEAGCDSHLSKPVVANVLLEVLKKYRS